MSAWKEVCKRNVSLAKGWDLTVRANRRELAAWKRRLWFAKYGRCLSVAIGAAAGSTATHLAMLAFGWT